MKKIFSLSIAGIFCLLAATACNVSVNKSIRIEDGETVTRSLNTVNGNIVIGEDCVVQGECRTVNGRISVGRNSRVEDLQCVNGHIRVEEGVSVAGDIESVNGGILCSDGVEVRGDVGTINGSIELEGTRVGRNVWTYNGDITLQDSCDVRGDIVVEKNKGSSSHKRHLKIRIAGNSTVAGDILVKDPDTEVTVVLADGSKVEGEIEGAQVREEN